MAEEEKEHPATPRQRQRFAERGEKVEVRELSTAVLISVAGAVLWATAGDAAGRLARVVRVCLTATEHPGTPLFSLAAHTYWSVMRPVMVAAVLSVIALALIRQRGAISFSPPKINFARLNPAAKLGQLFGSGQAFFGVGKSVMKMLAVGGLCAWVLWRELPVLLQHVPASLATAGGQSGALLGNVFVRAAFALLLIGAWEAWRSYVKLEKRMTMSAQEVRDEVKEQVGDPQIRSRIKAKGRELFKKRMLLRVPKADVVVVNPTHVAVALAYEADKMDAPVVLAKGAGDWAERIRTIARRHGVPIVQEPPLARMLFKQVEVGDGIPGELYQAVAVVLAHVYRLKPRRR